MNRLSRIGGLLKKLYRHYSSDLLLILKEKGFTDLRPSFLEILCVVCEQQGVAIKLIGESCGLKKQTMTSHLNELERRGYIERKSGLKDKREQEVYLTNYGERFKFCLTQALDEVQKRYIEQVGSLEFERIELMLDGLLRKLSDHGPILKVPKELLQNLVQTNQSDQIT